MAIAFDASTDGGTANATTLTWAHTCTGTNLILFVTATTNGATVTGITYNGVAMTSAGNVATGSNHSYLYYLIAPATGANNVVVTLSGSANVSGASASYTSVFQGALDSATSDSNAASTSITVSTTTVNDNAWLVSGGSTSASVASAGSNTTVRQSTSSIFHPYLTDSNASQTPAGSHSQSVSCSNGGNTMVIVSIRQLPQALTRTPSDSIMVGASRVVTIARLFSGARTLADSIMNAAGRLVFAFITGRASTTTLRPSVDITRSPSPRIE